MRRTSTRLVVVIGLLIMPSAVLAQRPDPVTCPREPLESDRQWADRCNYAEQKKDADGRSKAMNQQLAATEQQRRALEKQPPLAAARNRLLGRWQSATSKPAANADPFAQLSAMLTGCGVLIGDGIVEFTPDRWAVYDSDGRNDMGAISYRGGANGEVYGLPAQGSIFNLLPFAFETPDRIRLINVACTLVRTNAAPSTGRASVPAATGRGTVAAPAPASRTGGPGVAKPPAAAPSPSSPATPRTGLQLMKDRIGYQCPDGQQLAVQSCGSEANDADCLVTRVDQPLRNGLEVTFIDTRAALLKRVASCTQRGLAVKDRVLVLVP